jgi:multidrug resistance protein
MTPKMSEKTAAILVEARHLDSTSKLEQDFYVDRLEQPIKLDKHGLPLVPQPSDHKDDPLNWPPWQKYWIVMLMSAFTLTAQFGAALLNPAFVQVAKDLHVTVEQASYTTTVFILFTGVFPLFITPFANVYGRRILYLIFTIIAIAGYVGSAASRTWGGVIAGRVFSGIGNSIPVGIGAATICDLFVQGERGVPMGIYAWATTNGPHVAPIAGGYIAQRYGWRWAIWIPAIILGVLFILALFTFPETLFSREQHNNLEERSYLQKLLFHGKVLDRDIQTRDFFLPLRMAKYAAVTLPCITYMVTITYGSPLFAVTGSFIGSAIYHFNLEQTGLFLGGPLTVGCFIGELSAGWVSDLIINTYAKRHGGYRKAEARLYLLPLVAFTAIGVATFGYCIEKHKPWIQAVVCMAIAGFGTQVCTTVVYTYCCDSYKPQSSEISVIINLFKCCKLISSPLVLSRADAREVYAFNVGFYGLPITDKLGFTTGFVVLSAISAFVLIFPLFLVFFGEMIREWQGYPKEHQDL